MARGIQARLARLEASLMANRRAPCPVCHGAVVIIVSHVDEDGTVTPGDGRCPRCGSPHAVEIVLQVVPGASDDGEAFHG